MIKTAISEAERATSVEMAVVIAKVSDAYQSYCLLYGFSIGMLLGLSLWALHYPLSFPLFVALQLVCAFLFCFLPPIKSLIYRFIPHRIKHHRASQRAYEEFFAAYRQLPAAKPLVVLYVSLAERYSHILTSRSISELLPATQWKAVIGQFTASVTPSGFTPAFIDAIRQCAQLLAPHFPYTGEKSALSNEPREL